LRQTFYKKQLVLLGGGHAHVQVLRKLCMNFYNGLHVILINDSQESAYSGMTPGYIQDFYKINEIMIDLQRLCFNAGVTFINDEVIRLQTEKKKVILKNRPSIHYDLLSINTGCISKKNNIKIHENSKYIFIKPINNLIKNLKTLDEIVKNTNNVKINIIGGGVAAFEIGFALRQRFQNKVSISIISKNILLEKNLNTRTISELKKISENMNISLKESDVVEIKKEELLLSNGEIFPSDLNLISTGAEMPEWIQNTSLEKNDGFIGIKTNLQSINDENIFAAGDVASIQDYRRPKSGIMAVRQGQILKENIFLKIQGKKLKKFRPQKNWLYIIGTYPNKALLNYMHFSFHSKWCWILKKWIDKSFIKKFSFPNKLNMKKKIVSENFEIPNQEMYCQGCGSKISKAALIDYLSENSKNNELADSSIVKFSNNQILQTVDHIKLFNSIDPFDFGIISYLHSQNDIIAAGGSVHSINISVGVPFGNGNTEIFYLKSFMKGVEYLCKFDNASIVSGHSYQTFEPGITINMNGIYKHESKKTLAKENNLIYLSKPLGVGYLLAAYFKNSDLLDSEDFKKVLSSMKLSNKNASEIAKKHQTKSMTDISGFGLASHLGDICKSSGLTANIHLDEKLLINPNLKILKNFQSTGYKSNYQSVSQYVNSEGNNPYLDILYDPQTNGPLLMIIEENNKDSFEKDFSNHYKKQPILIGNFINKKEHWINVIN
jgi:selenide,water dikinase